MEIKQELVEWYRALLRNLPGEAGCKLRNALYGFQSDGGCRVLSGVVIYHPQHLRLGRNVTITRHTQINAAGEVTIGDDTLVGPRCAIWSANHRYRDPDVPIRLQGYEYKPVAIGSDCWLATGVIVLPGVSLGNGSVVAAGAVVTTSFAPGSIIAGVPAKAIGKRH